MSKDTEFKVAGQVLMIPIGRLLENELNVYMRGLVLTAESVAELTQSVKANGVETPLLVTPVGDAFRIICGHRRRLSAKVAGLFEVPCIIRENVDEEEQFTLMMNENLQRKSLTVLAEAACYAKVVSEGKSVSDIERDTGVGKARIKQLLSLLKLPAVLHPYFDQGRLPLGAIDVLAKISREEELVQLARAAVNGRWALSRLIEKVDERLDAVMERGTISPPRRFLRGSPLVDNAGERLTKSEALALFNKGQSFSLQEIKRAILSSCCNECDEAKFPMLCRDCPISQMLACLLHTKRVAGEAAVEGPSPAVMTAAGADDETGARIN